MDTVAILAQELNSLKMFSIDYVKLYSVDQVDSMCYDKMFDAHFIQKTLRFVGTSALTFVNAYHCACGYGGKEYEWETEQYPLVYSESYAADWWRLNSPTRFCEVPEIDHSIYGSMVVDEDTMSDLQSNLTSFCSSVAHIVRNVYIPVFPYYYSTQESTTGSEMVDATNLTISNHINAIIERINVLIESRNKGLEPVYGESERRNVLYQIHRRNMTLVARSVFADIVAIAMKNFSGLEANAFIERYTQLHSRIRDYERSVDKPLKLRDMPTYDVVEYNDVIWTADANAYNRFLKDESDLESDSA